MNEFSNLSHEEAAWQAFRYVAGELTVDEQTAFERQLVADQGLREAVAGVVETSRAVRAVESRRAPVATVATGESPRVGGWSVLLGALALTLVVAFAWWPTASVDSTNVTNVDDSQDGKAGISSTDIDEEDVLAMWYSSANEVSGDEVLADDSLPLVDALSDGNGDFVVPGWMFAALEPERMDGMVEEMMDEMPIPGSTNN